MKHPREEGRDVDGNGTVAFWRKVGWVCGGVLAAILLVTTIWKGASTGAALSWRYANRENAVAMNSIIDRLTALQVRDSLYNVRLGNIEDVVFKRHRPR